MDKVEAMNIEEINKRHLLKSDIVYRVHFGLSSRLVTYRNGIFTIEVIFGPRWNKGYKQTALELAYEWRNKHRELSRAIGCKVYIIDAKKYPYKKELYETLGKAEYDAREGLLFYKDYLN